MTIDYSNKGRGFIKQIIYRTKINEIMEKENSVKRIGTQK